MTVALYARVSTAGQTCEQQLTALREYAGRMGWEALEYIDHAQSGAKLSRPALDLLMADARRRKIRVVLVAKMDRFGRSVMHLSSLIHDLDSLGVRFMAIEQGVDTDKANPAARLLLNILASVAEFERELIRDRTKAGLERVKAAGGTLGRPVLNLPAEMLDRIREMQAAGLSLRQIAAALPPLARGGKRATPISRETVRRALVDTRQGV